jgi:hypothetical protein
MGTLSTKGFFKKVLGIWTEEKALTTSAGAADADKIPALNASGVLDHTILNAATTSAGAGSSNKIPALGGDGRLSQTMMPIGVGNEAKTMTTGEALSAGNYVNVYSDAGVFKVRKADATTAGKEAHGYVVDAASSGATVTVYFEGVNSAVTGMTPGAVWLHTTAGQGSATAPSASGNVQQHIGTAISATEVNFEPQEHVVLA